MVPVAKMEISLTARGFARGSGRVLDALLSVAVVAVGVCTVLTYLSSVNWIFDLFSHFRVQYVIGLSIILLLCALRNKLVLAVTAAVFIVPNLWVITTDLIAAPDNELTGGSSFRVVALNVRASNTRYADLLQAVKEFDPDVLLLLEVTDSWQRVATRLEPTYPFAHYYPRADNYGIALLSRHPVISVELIHVGGSDLPILHAGLEIDEARIDLIGVHLRWPFGKTRTDERNRQLRALGNLLANADVPTIVAGDFNTTPWSDSFRAMTGAAGGKRLSYGYGLSPTWPAFLPPFLIPIDHVVVTPDLQITAKFSGSSVGSDHLPLVADIRFRQSNLQRPM